MLRRLKGFPNREADVPFCPTAQENAGQHAAAVHGHHGDPSMGQPAQQPITDSLHLFRWRSALPGQQACSEQPVAWARSDCRLPVQGTFMQLWHWASCQAGYTHGHMWVWQANGRSGRRCSHEYKT